MDAKNPKQYHPEDPQEEELTGLEPKTNLCLNLQRGEKIVIEGLVEIMLRDADSPNARFNANCVSLVVKAPIDIQIQRKPDEGAVWPSKKKPY